MLAALALAGTSLPALGQDKAQAQQAKKPGPNRMKSAGGDPSRADAVGMAATAERLARYGEEKKDPLALITAARIKLEVGERVTDRKQETRGGQGDARKPAKWDTSAQALLARAKTLAGGRPDLVALADEVASSARRGHAEGPLASTAVVRGGATHVVTLTFKGGEPAVVEIIGDGDTDLDLLVFDDNGHPICTRDSPYGDESCRWHPRRTGQYRVEVINIGPVANQYRMLTN
jgi:hypothetical protein